MAKSGGTVRKTTTSAGTTGKPITHAQHGHVAAGAPKSATKPGKGK